MRTLLCFTALFLYLNARAQHAVPGRTTGPLPYLEYGLGDDRLGGAKMTYLDTGILLQMIDSNATDYKVRLSANHVAYLPKQNWRKDSATILQPHYLSASWKLTGDERYDLLSLSLPEKLPYRSIQQINPARIVVDIFGLTSNTNWITQLKSAREVRNVWYEQVEDDVLRIFIELRHPRHWGYGISYNKNNLQIRVKQQPTSLKLKKLLIGIDAGHGGSNTGATGGQTGILEKDYTLMVAKELQKRLQCRKVQVLMTREDDSDLSMIDRTLWLRGKEPDLLISIHLNSSSNKEISGVSTYYRYIGFRPLSQKILDRMLELPLNNFGNIGSFNFALSGPTEYPNCLVELAFLSNAEDEKKILDKNFRKAAAKKIYKGIRDWLKAMN